MERGAIDWMRKTIDSRAAKPAAERSPFRGASESITTFIDQGVECAGTLRLKVSARIDGEFKGDIETEANLIVGEAAGVEANLTARDIVISGAVVGNVKAARSVVLRATGKLHGDVEAPSLVIERGAVFNGRSTMTSPQAALYAGQRKPAADAEPAVVTPPA